MAGAGDRVVEAEVTDPEEDSEAVEGEEETRSVQVPETVCITLPLRPRSIVAPLHHYIHNRAYSLLCIL